MERTIKVDGKDVALFETEPLNSNEKWNEYQMSNGDILKVKLILTRVLVSNEKVNNKQHVYQFDFKAISDVISVDK